MYCKEFSTQLSAFEIFSIFKEDSYCFFLDSGMDPHKLGRYSIIGSKPFLIFRSKNNYIEILENDSSGSIKEKTCLEGNPFKELEKLLQRYHSEDKGQLPFYGGAVGYFGYDLCHHIERLPRKAVDDIHIPDCHFGFYDCGIVIDHKNNQYYAVASDAAEADQSMERLINRIKLAEDCIKVTLPEQRFSHKSFRSNFTKEDYIKALIKISDYIKAGDIYQANMTQRFECELDRSPYELYHILRSINPAPFAAYLDIKEAHILSSSPERFIKIVDKDIETRPIKGTRPRGLSREEDQSNKEELLCSEKDKAELLMIVDLERNDLGRVCDTGTVKVTELFHLEEYATVYHLVSTVIGHISDEHTELDAIIAAFPGGSITGAPKIRAMEIIDELEPTQRNIYTGSIGYMSFNGRVDLNIAIRTILAKDNKAYFQTGGGIVWDSEPELEYEETFHKAKAMMKALEY